MNFLDIAIKYNYFIKVKNIKDMNGCIVEFPKNILLDINSASYIYLITGSGVELYDNSFSLINFVECPNFASRAIIIFDTLMKAYKRDILPALITCYKDEVILGDYINFKKLICDVEKPELETKLISSLAKIQDDTALVDKDVSEVFNFIKSKVISNGEILC